MTPAQMRKQISTARRALVNIENYYYSIPDRDAVEKENVLNLVVAARFKLDEEKAKLGEYTRTQNALAAKNAPKA
jgi:hypothetical protein